LLPSYHAPAASLATEIRMLVLKNLLQAHTLMLCLQLARETTCLVESYVLPDGRVIRVGAERFTAPEAMFKPSLMGVEAPGIAEMAFNCIQV
jgi:actin-related protein 2